jgi:stage V sporulation protein G
MNENTNNAVNETAGADLKLDSNVRLITPKNNLLAFASVKIADCFVAGEKGLFVDMPSAQDAKGNYRDICFPVTAAFREKLNTAVLDGYAAAVEKNKDIGKAQREFAEKPGIAERLEAGKQKAAEYNASRPAPTPGRVAGAAEVA